MGYYTYFSMEARGIKDENEYNSIIDAMKKNELMSYDDVYGIFDEGKFYENDGSASFEAYQEAKWYDCEYDMVKFSKLFPDVTFKLSGDGEERDDMWREYFHNGECELCHAQVVFPLPVEIEWEE